ncbi:FAD-dependent oxidoreductase [Parabacteroides sp. Marseille-P3160]|uniref:FAD-dependent oxidoreductase n=1 Tax=Parabacteroides sp. Marseille-P3160 TaxID=1917887 RepID=UPI0009BA02B4|nr:FAD-dependent oxidoreductase [Parabacteroides sp. Marseille-P3160]
MIKKILFVVLLYYCLVSNSVLCAQVWVEAEQFDDKGGWIIDPQFMDQMGSPYLLAHGLGEPVDPATTTVLFKDKGAHYVWIRTKDWAPFPVGPGSFQLTVNNEELPVVFGQDGNSLWHWQYGGKIDIKSERVVLTLKDLSGFEGRVDALYFSKREDDAPPNGIKELTAFRRKMLQMPARPLPAGDYDLVVAGGGVAGICASIQAARLGLKVALIQNRPILGGNNSSEIRIPMSGDIYRNLYPKLGRIVRELNTGIVHEIGSVEQYGDKRKQSIVNNEKNISLFLSMHVYGVEKQDNKITAILAREIESGKEYRFNAPLFADCTGDASLGVAAGASHRTGRESFTETREPKAPEIADSLTLGTTNHWYATFEKEVSDFPLCPWAVTFTDKYYLSNTSSAWFWESGFYKDKVEDAEKVRDYNFRVVYGHWSYLKNKKKEEYANWKLKWMAFIAGKRESRRLEGDIMLSELDINNRIEYPDACVTTTWGIDLHYPDPENSKYYPGAEFLGIADHDRNFEPYHIPYRCFYSKDIDNLFMAGRNISATHIASGTVRVMKTTGMMGEVVGMAAYLCKKHQCTPREVYTHYLSELIALLKE